MIGDLNRRVQYQEPPTSPTADAYGQFDDTPTTIATVWAQIRTPTGRELLNAGQFEAVVSHTLTIRRPTAWTPRPRGRFLYASPVYNPTPRIFNIVAVFDPDESNTFLSCLVTELASPVLPSS